MAEEPEEEGREPDELELLRQREIDTAWSMVRACLRTAARTGLPREQERLAIARELEAAAGWLRLAGRPKTPAAQPRTSAPTVQIRRRQRQVKLPLQLLLDRRLWDQLGQPPRLQLSIEADQVQLRPAPADAGQAVRVGYLGPQLAYAEGELPLGEGGYAAEVRAGAIVIRERLADTDEPAEAEE
jgi:hypothetical protein